MSEQTVTLEDATKIALVHMKQENYRVAELVLQDIIKAAPNDANAHYMLGLARYFMGNIQAGLPHIETAVNSEEPFAEWWCNYGIMLTELKRYDEAKEAYDKAIAADPDYGESYWNKSHSLWLTGDYEQAEDAARKGLEINPESEHSYLNLGTALVKQDKKEEAISCWEKAVEINPDFVFAWNNLGNVMRDIGQLEAAAEKCRRALEIDPNYPQALNNLGNALIDLGDLKQAEELYKKSVANQPDYVEAHNNLALTYIKQHRFTEAAQQARIALSYNPHYYEALLSLAAAKKATGDLDEAEKAIQQASMIKPDSAEVRIELADLLFMRDQYSEAEIELERARALEPDTPRVYLKLAEVLDRGNKVEEALEAIDKAIEINPEMPELYLKKGLICHVANRIEEAERYILKSIDMSENMANAHLALAELYLSTGEKERAYERVKQAQALSSDSTSLYYTLAKTKKFTAEDEDFKEMVELEKQGEALGVQQLSALNFALFGAYENIGDYEKAFEHLKRANDCKRRVIPYNPAQQAEIFSAIPEMFTPESMKEYEGKGCTSDLPVFIIGMPRSGTTLTEQIISSHADVFGAGELTEISSMDNQLGFITPETAKTHGEWYIDQVKKRDSSGKAKRITDKMPANFASLGKILCMLPNAKIIHSRRNPIDTCLSCYKQSFARGQYWSYELSELGQYYNQYLELMAYWRDVLGDRFIEVDYETTVADLEPQAKRMIEYIDLPWDEACLEPHKQKRAVLTASKSQVTQPVYKSSVQAWKRYEKQLQPLIDALAAGPAKELLDL